MFVQLEDLGGLVRNADDIVDEAYRNGVPNLVEIVRAANQIVLVSAILHQCLFRLVLIPLF